MSTLQKYYFHFRYYEKTRNGKEKPMNMIILAETYEEAHLKAIKQLKKMKSFNGDLNKYKLLLCWIEDQHI